MSCSSDHGLPLLLLACSLPSMNILLLESTSDISQQTLGILCVAVIISIFIEFLLV